MRGEYLQKIRTGILDRAGSSENKIILSRMLDLAERSLQRQLPTYSDFLDPSQIQKMITSFDRVPDISLCFWGGYPEAERKMAVFLPANELQPTSEDYPIKLFSVSGKGIEYLNHRDYLGSLMSLGIKREKTGDILPGSKQALMFISEDISSYIEMNLLKIAGTTVSIIQENPSNILIGEKKHVLKKMTIASLRIDCLLSASLDISRSSAVALLQEGKVSINWTCVVSSSHQVKEGDTLSVRGFGRFELNCIGGNTKKGRIAITIKRFI